MGRQPKLDVVLISRGGSVNAAHRLALLLLEYTDDLSFIVPDRCESAAVVLCMAGQEIIAGPATIFTPVDPSLHGAEQHGPSPKAVSAEDIRLFPEVIKDWFGIDADAAEDQALEILCENIFPTTLSSFYRSIAECRLVCHALLSSHMGKDSDDDISKIYEPLLYPRLPHSFALTDNNLKSYGFPIHRDSEIETPAWEIANILRNKVGGASINAKEGSRVDVFLATSELARIRFRNPDNPSGVWTDPETVYNPA
ncbi:hypothetical protein N9W89_11060 [Hellea sp.]|nr:hypothetical protein [Hellea sp.]